jgi:CheY-like chemotaxis protein
MKDPSLRRILFVEDDPDIQTVAKMALEAIGGFHVLACGSGSEALSRLGEFAPDLVLLDVMMPGMDGPTTLAALRQIPKWAPRTSFPSRSTRWPCPSRCSPSGIP